MCIGTQNGGKGCTGVKSQTKQCIADCPHPWSDWSSCSSTCGVGIKTRRRKWTECVKQNNCPVERLACQSTVLQCAPRWTEWNQWSKCVGGCDGNKYRSRHCYGEECIRRNESEAKKCICHGTPSLWSLWSTCSQTCGIGFKVRSRSCSNNFCRENLKEKKPCYAASCIDLDTSDTDNILPEDPFIQKNKTKTDSENENETNYDIRDLNFTCPAGMEKSSCLSVCTIKSCEDLNQPMPLEYCSSSCVPGCICPSNTVESNGKCIPLSECDCKDANGRYWPPKSSWKIHGQTCSICECDNGLVTCKQTDCRSKNCDYTEWSSWTVCNSECIDVS